MRKTHRHRHGGEEGNLVLREGNLVFRDGKTVVRREKRKLPSLLNPLNWLLLLAAVISASAILLYALSEVAMRRARELGYKDEE